MSDSKEKSLILENMKKRRHCDNDNQNQDRFSDLPDFVLLHILSFLNTKHVVRTCVLSKRWKHLWKRISTLMLHSTNFSTVRHFATFVSKILTLRDTSTALHALDLDRHGDIEPQLLKKVLNYVCSHNAYLEELGISVSADSSLIMRCVSSCHALTSLKLSLYPRRSCNHTPTVFPKSLNLPSLTSLNLTNFVFCGAESGCVEPFFAFTKLNSLVINSCKVKDAQILSISSDTLVNLAIKDPLEIINLATQTDYSSNFAEIKLSTPNLNTFNFTGDLIQKICRSGLSSVKQVNIDHSLQDDASVEHGLVIFNWLLDFANVESLTVTSTTLQILYLVPDLLEVKLPSLCKLKSLEVELTPLDDGYLSQTIKDSMLKKAAAKSDDEEFYKLIKAFKYRLELPPIPDGIIDFLRQNSPSAQVTFTTEFPHRFNLMEVEESDSAASPNLYLC
ncbi:F-box/LRR-repeat protein [Trifolium repens]|nr:F-box/LRR-repeat protein [Trifolium repens]